MRKWMQVGGLLLLAVFAASPWRALAAEEPSASSFGDTVRVEVADVEVVVTNRSGKPVRGLQQADFELWVGGKRQEITNFFAVEGGQRLVAEGIELEGGAAPAGARVPLAWAIYVDDANLSPVHRNRVLKELPDLLRKRVGQGDRVMVARYDSSLRVVQGLTGDFGDLRAALETLSESSTFDIGPDARQRESLKAMADLDKLLSELPFPDPCSVRLQDLAEEQVRADFARVKAGLDALGSFVDSLSGVPGRKVVLHVSDGIPRIAGRESLELLIQLCGGGASRAKQNPNGPAGPSVGRGANTGESEDADVDAASAGRSELNATPIDAHTLTLDVERYSTASLLRTVTERANAARVSIFPIEASGVRNAASSTVDFDDDRVPIGEIEKVRVANLQDSLFNLASETGGRAALNVTQVLPALEGLADGVDTYYSLGFSPPAGEHARGVEVKVRKPGMDLVYRKSFKGKTGAERLADRTLGTLLFGIEDNPLGIEASATRPSKLDDELFMVPVRVRIPIGRLILIPGETAHTGKLNLQVAARDRHGKLAPVRTVEIPLSIPNDQLEVARTKFFVYEIKMLMREGEHSLTVGLEDTVGATSSFVLVEVPVTG